jgi:hypothetical protein
VAWALAVSVVPKGAIALRNKLVSAMVDLPDSRDSRQGLSQANANVYRVAAGKLSISITVVGDFGTTFCSPAFWSLPMTDKHRFEWGYVEHPGIWACGGGRQDIPPVLIGITFQVPQKEPEYAWWCYLGPRPEFENELDPKDKDKRYFDQCDAVPQRITKNMGIEKRVDAG